MQELRELVLCYLRVRDLLRKWKSSSQLCILGAVREALSAEGFPKKVKIKDLHQLNEVLNTQGLAGRGRGESKKAQRGQRGRAGSPGNHSTQPLESQRCFPSCIFRRNIPKNSKDRREKGETCHLPQPQGSSETHAGQAWDAPWLRGS